MKRIIRLPLRERSYDILVGSSLLKDCGRIIKRLKLGDDAVVITNKVIRNLYAKTLERSLKKASITVHLELVPDSERAKSIEVSTKAIKRITEYDKNKNIFLAAFGGGVTGDLAGFVAAVYKRGVPYVQIPTTLLAQVDSAIGGKVALDLPAAKNLVGSFNQPAVVISDIALLKTLSRRQVVNGLAEVIKYGVIKDAELFEYLEDNYKVILGRDQKALEFIVSRSSAIKASLVANDEFEKKGLRTILNFGHTIGHAIEAAAGYSTRYYHGEAIAVGMIAASRISERMRLMKAADADRIGALIERVGLPTRIRGLSLSRIYEAHLHDKKFIHKKNRFVLPVRIGHARVVEGIPDSVVMDALKWLS